MRIRLAGLGLAVVATIALALGVVATRAEDSGSVTTTVTLLPNQADDAGCWLGDSTMPAGDFGEIVRNGATWAGSQDARLDVSLRQDYQPQALDCRIEVEASDLAVTGTTGTIPRDNLALAGCDIAPPISLAVPRALTCAVASGDTSVALALSLGGLDHQPAGPLDGSLIVTALYGR